MLIPALIPVTQFKIRTLLKSEDTVPELLPISTPVVPQFVNTELSIVSCEAALAFTVMQEVAKSKISTSCK